LVLVAENDMINKLMAAGVAFTQMSRTKAEGIVKELVRLGEVQVEEAQATAQHLIDKGRENTEQLVALVRSEVERQLRAMGVRPSRSGPAPAAAPTEAAAKKAPAKKSAAKKSAAKKTPAKKSAAKSATKKSAAKKAPAKKRTAKR